jgi:uncharacterized repeat protein (TIGR03809 family)
MSEQQSPGPLDAVAQKWRALAERRCAHFVELFESGRWKRYYSEEQFLRCLREAIALSERWAMIAPRPAGEIEAVIDKPTASVDESAIDGTAAAVDEPVTGIPRRSAA